jgi:deazaflavin-dependent oxidoreductase (nitroreductase family)
MTTDRHGGASSTEDSVRGGVAERAVSCEASSECVRIESPIGPRSSPLRHSDGCRGRDAIIPEGGREDGAGARRVRGSVEMRGWVIRGLSKAHVTVYRMTRGRVLGSVAGMPVLLLTTAGRRSGKARTTPLTFLRDGTDLVVIASNGGADRPPDWSLNLQQTPRAVVRIGTDKLVVTARPASEQERERLWVVITATYAGYARYQERTTRRIPVVLLTPEGRQVER